MEKFFRLVPKEVLFIPFDRNWEKWNGARLKDYIWKKQNSELLIDKWNNYASRFKVLEFYFEEGYALNVKSYDLCELEAF